MSRRHAKRFGTAPTDPRTRAVVSSHHHRGSLVLSLDCGHTVRRRFLCAPARVICTQCPAAGGIGGSQFGKGR